MPQVSFLGIDERKFDKSDIWLITCQNIKTTYNFKMRLLYKGFLTIPYLCMRIIYTPSDTYGEGVD